MVFSILFLSYLYSFLREYNINKVSKILSNLLNKQVFLKHFLSFESDV